MQYYFFIFVAVWICLLLRRVSLIKAQIVLADGSGVLNERVIADYSFLSQCYKGGLFVELFYVTGHMTTRH
jgi:hypothetical protein